MRRGSHKMWATFEADGRHVEMDASQELVELIKGVDPWLSTIPQFELNRGDAPLKILKNERVGLREVARGRKLANIPAAQCSTLRGSTSNVGELTWVA